MPLVLGGNCDAHMDMVRHQVPFENLAFLLPRQPMENLPQLAARLPEDGFPQPFRHEHNMVLAVPAIKSRQKEHKKSPHYLRDNVSSETSTIHWGHSFLPLEFVKASDHRGVEVRVFRLVFSCPSGRT